MDQSMVKSGQPVSRRDQGRSRRRTRYCLPALSASLTSLILHVAIAPPPLQAQPDPCRNDCPSYTHRDISQTHFMQPSLWWSVRELGGRLIPEWVVYPNEQRVDLTIDPQRWNWMDYFDRYTLVTQLANVLRPQGYSLRIFDPQQPDTPIASYTCDFSSDPPACQLHFSN